MTDRPPQVEDGHPPGSPELREAWNRRYPERVDMPPAQRIQAAQMAAGAAMQAARRGETCPTALCRWPKTEHRHDPGQPVLQPLWRG